MLVPTMTDAEVFAEVLRDYKRLEETTLGRLHHEYSKERQKLKIDKSKTYPKTYRIKTAAKNNWMIVMSKGLCYPKNEGFQHQETFAMTYYYSKEGYRFFRTCGKDGALQMFTGHFFTRYNERLNLKLNNHLDIVEHFLTNSGKTLAFQYLEEGNDYFVSFCKAGLALGVYDRNANFQVFKTFISHNMKHNGQKTLDVDVQASIRKGLAQQILYYQQADPGYLIGLKGIILEVYGNDNEFSQMFNLYADKEINNGKLPAKKHPLQSNAMLRRFSRSTYHK